VDISIYFTINNRKYMVFARTRFLSVKDIRLFEYHGPDSGFMESLKIDKVWVPSIKEHLSFRWMWFRSRIETKLKIAKERRKQDS